MLALKVVLNEAEDEQYASSTQILLSHQSSTLLILCSVISMNDGGKACRLDTHLYVSIGRSDLLVCMSRFVRLRYSYHVCCPWLQPRISRSPTMARLLYGLVRGGLLGVTPSAAWR